MMTKLDTPDTAENSDSATQSPDASAPESHASPFAAAPEAAAVPEAAPSPFAAAPEAVPSPFTATPNEIQTNQALPAAKSTPAKSPFTVVTEEDDLPPNAYRLAKIPEKRKPESPFLLADPTQGFGGTPPMQGIPVSPFEAAYATPTSPFLPANDFHGYPGAQPPQMYAQTYAHHPYAGSPFFGSHPGFSQPSFPPPSTYPQASHAPYSPPPAHSYAPQAACSSVRQIELRAIFGVDHEMNTNEIIQRCRALPGIQNIAFIGGQETNTIESLKTLISKLGYDSSELHISAGQTHIEFIQESSVLLAVQTDGSNFAAGVRETLMIVAREMSRLT